MKLTVPSCPKCNYNPCDVLTPGQRDLVADDTQSLFLAIIAHMLTHLVKA